MHFKFCEIGKKASLLLFFCISLLHASCKHLVEDKEEPKRHPSTSKIASEYVFQQYLDSLDLIPALIGPQDGSDNIEYFLRELDLSFALVDVNDDIALQAVTQYLVDKEIEYNPVSGVLLLLALDSKLQDFTKFSSSSQPTLLLTKRNSNNNSRRQRNSNRTNRTQTNTSNVSDTDMTRNVPNDNDPNLDPTKGQNSNTNSSGTTGTTATQSTKPIDSRRGKIVIADSLKSAQVQATASTVGIAMNTESRLSPQNQRSKDQIIDSLKAAEAVVDNNLAIDKKLNPDRTLTVEDRNLNIINHLIQMSLFDELQEKVNQLDNSAFFGDSTAIVAAKDPNYYFQQAKGMLQKINDEINYLGYAPTGWIAGRASPQDIVQDRSSLLNELIDKGQVVNGVPKDGWTLYPESRDIYAEAGSGQALTGLADLETGLIYLYPADPQSAAELGEDHPAKYSRPWLNPESLTMFQKTGLNPIIHGAAASHTQLSVLLTNNKVVPEIADPKDANDTLYFQEKGTVLGFSVVRGNGFLPDRFSFHSKSTNANTFTVTGAANGEMPQNYQQGLLRTLWTR